LTRPECIFVVFPESLYVGQFLGHCNMFLLLSQIYHTMKLTLTPVSMAVKCDEALCFFSLLSLQPTFLPWKKSVLSQVVHLFSVYSQCMKRGDVSQKTHFNKFVPPKVEGLSWKKWESYARLKTKLMGKAVSYFSVKNYNLWYDTG